jgi:DNA processing protein
VSNDDRLRLACVGLHPERTRGLLERYGGASGAVRALEKGKVDVSERARAAVAVSAAAQRDQLAAAGVSVVMRGDDGYPPHLAVYPDAPDVLFVRGTLPQHPCVAVVGTRKCTAYGRRLARQYGRAIAEAGWVASSGLARGIDGAAHEGTVAASGIGVAVLGCGLDVAYPPEHAPLGRRLVDGGGAVVSEYPLGTPPEGWRFPPRNRIISGLAAAVVVVEAGVRGGALITAAKALDQGLPVFAVPGDVERASSRGTNLLIRDGAHPVLDSDDLIEELALVMGPGRHRAETGHDEMLAVVRAHAPAHVADLVARSGRPAEWVFAELDRLLHAGAIERHGEIVVPR